MAQPAFSYHRPLLIIDKKGTLGSLIINDLPKKQVVVFVTSKKYSPEKNVVILPYGPGVPRIPDNTFSTIIAADLSVNEIKDYSPSLLEKAKKDNSKLYFINNVYSLTMNFLQIYKKCMAHASLILYADIISEKIPFANRAELLISSAVKNNKLVLQNSGLDIIYPVLEKDFITWIINVLLEDKPPRVLCLFTSLGVTELSFARYLTEKLDDLVVILKDNNAESEPLLLPKNSIFIPPADYSVQQELRKVNFKNFAQINNVKVKMTKIKDKNENTTLLVIAAVLLVIFLLISTPLFFLFLGKLALQGSISQLGSVKLSSSAALAQAAVDNFSLAKSTDMPLKFVCSIVGINQSCSQLSDDMDAGEGLGQAMIYVSNAAEDFRTANSNSSKVNDGLANIRYALTIVNQLEAEKKFSGLPVYYQQEIDFSSNLASQVLTVLPDLFGYSGSRQYLILFLNNNELRPGGGFIGSYAQLTVKNGVIGKPVVHDVYEADGQLQGHVNPPDPLQKYMGLTNWFLRDSNFSVDQYQNAKTESYFYKLETNNNADGVITIDSSLIQDLLSLTGPIMVTDYNQTVTADNFFQLTEDHAEQKFFPGSQAKKDFLSSFSTALRQKLMTHPLSIRQIIDFTLNELQQKHLSFYVNNNIVQQALSQTVFGQDETDLQILNNGSGVFDFFADNEANVGGNKDNHYIKRSFSHEIQVGADGSITHTVNITLSNPSQTGNPYSGDYKVFMRLIIPKSAAINQLSINKQIQNIVSPNQSTNPIYKGHEILSRTGLTVYQENVYGKTSYGFYLDVKSGTTTTVSLTYLLGQKLSGTQNYSLMLYKQPGTNADTTQFSLQTYPSWKIDSTDNQAIVTNNSLTEQLPLLNDKIIHVSLSK